MLAYKRFAVYFAPRPDDPLHEFGRGWFGADPDTGWNAPAESRALPDMALEEHLAMTETARRYALHGTLKPPFHLAEGATASALSREVATLAKRLAPVNLGAVVVRSLGRFLALCPIEPPTSLPTLAARCVSDLDGFRAPPSEAELTRRRKAGLSGPQEANLQRWGYPYVMEEFRFHVTLTGPLDDARRSGVAEGLRDRLAEVRAEPLWVRDLCLFAELGDGTPFQCVERFPLGG